MPIPEHPQLQAIDVVHILRRRMRLVLLSMLCALLLALAYLFWTTPLYTAQSLVLVQPNAQNLLDPNAQQSFSGQAENAYVESEVEILRSDSVALAAVEAGNVVVDPEFGPSLGLFAKAKQAMGVQSPAPTDGARLLARSLARFKAARTARRRGPTYVIGVSFTAQTPEKAARYANLLSETYVRLQVERKVAATLAARDVLDAQLAAAQRNLTASDAALSAYIEGSLPRLRALSDDPRLVQLQQSLTRSRAESAELTERYDRLAEVAAQKQWAQLSELEDAAIRALVDQREVLDARLSGSVRAGDDMLSLRAQIDDLDAELERAAQTALTGLQSQISQSARSSAATLNDLRAAMFSTDLPPDMLAELYGMQQNASIAQRQYDNLLSRLRDLEIQASVQVADSRIVSPAMVPTRTSFPNAKLVTALALVVGATVGGVVALLNEFYIGGVHSASQLSNLLRIRSAGTIPRVIRINHGLSAADAVIDQPMSIYSESIRRVRAAIDLALPRGAGQGQVVAVTSSLPAEGKSVVSLALARTYAQSGKRVLLIDADMRRPTQFKLLGLEPKSGLLEYLTSKNDPSPEDFYEIDPKSSLGVVLGHTRSEVPTDQPLQSQAFSDLLDEARGSFDMVIVDTPAALPVVDARYVIPLADCILMVVRAEATRQSEIRAGHDLIAESCRDSLPIVGVLNLSENGVSQRIGGAYYGEE